MPPSITELARRLGPRLRGRLEPGCSLAPYTTYRIGGPADLALFPADTADLARALELLAAERQAFTILGGGSNVLVSDRGVRGVVLITVDLDRIEVRGAELLAGAGASSHGVAVAAQQAGLSGAEFLTRLPGTIGGACYMNARAYGGEVSGVLARATVVSRSGELRELALPTEQFAYKRSPFQGSDEVIAEVTLSLHPGDSAEIGRRMDHIEEHRRARHEMDLPSCGCVFKNDPRLGMSAGQLIERCGLKGLCIGEAQVSLFHANFVVNRGRASAEHVRQVVEHVRAEVARQTGHRLELEVQLVGQWDPA